jgi:diguanylate cyclase (GGDEF)-like protein
MQLLRLGRALHRQFLAVLTSPIALVGVTGLAIVIAVLVGAQAISRDARERALESASQRLQNTAALVARHLDQQLADVAADQADLRERLRNSLPEDDDAWRHEAAAFRTHDLLRSKAAWLRVDTEYGVFGSDGTMLAVSSRHPPLPITARDRLYFKTLRDRPGADDSPVIDLVQSPITGRWFLISAVPLRRGDGSFRGVLTRRIDLEGVGDFLSSLTLPDGSAVAVHLARGGLVARHPALPHLVGQSLRERMPDLEPVYTRTSFSTRSTSALDGRERLLASHALSRFPLVVTVTDKVETALGQWTSLTEALTRGAIAAVVTLSLVFVLVIRLLLRRFRAGAERLAEERNRFARAVNNMDQGLLLFDCDERLIICSDRYLQIYGLDRDRIRPGMSLRALLEERAANGSLPHGVDDYYALSRQAARRGGRSTTTTGDGRVIRIDNNPLPDGGWVVTHTDITEQQNQHHAIEQLAHFDQLTGLPNRTLFRQRAEELLAALEPEQRLAVVYIDLDEFKAVNDTLGHRAGDALLVHVGGRLRAAAAGAPLVARLGGDEFAVVLPCASREELAPVLARLHEALRTPFDWAGSPVTSDASLGIAIAREDGDDLETLLSNADLALYAAKAAGRHGHCFYDPQMSAAAALRHALETELRVARLIGFAEAGFAVHYQPVADLGSGRITGCEALLRWRHPSRGTISPAEFIPAAEHCGVIGALGHWVLETACRTAAQWPGALRIAVNMSPTQIAEEGIVARIGEVLAATGLPPERLELEITEAVLVRDTHRTAELLAELRLLGIHLVLDDFGTGYSSLSYLHQFDFDKIKIDRSFVQQMTQSPASLAIVQSIIGLAAARQLRTTAEGIETEAQRDLLRALGCTEMQGYLLSPAVPDAALRLLLAGPSPALPAVA